MSATVGNEMIGIGLNYLADYVKNLTTDARLNYIVEARDWSIKQDGLELTKQMNRLRNTAKSGDTPTLKSRITTTPKGLKNKIIHFGSVNTYSVPHESNRCAMSWFHIVRNDENLKNIKEIGKNIEILHTTCEITRQAFIDMGANEDKIVKIPLGIDLNLFHPSSEINGYWELRNKLRLPPDVKIIGSFQKDGNGWGEGLEPKWVKNPEMFCQVVKNIHEQYDGKIFVLLLGVARGYVKRKLSQYGIPFKHISLKHFWEVPLYYPALDLYLVTSRSEGMPKAILESMASGVPIISTKVGIAPEIINHGVNGLLCDIDDTDAMTWYALDILNRERFASSLRYEGLKTAKAYSWNIIAKRFYNEIYKKLEE